MVYYINWLVFKVFKKLSLSKWISRVVISLKLLKRLKQLLNNIPKYIILFVWFVPDEYKKFYSLESPPTLKKMLFLRKRPRRIKKNYSSGIASDELKTFIRLELSPTNKKNCCCSGIASLTNKKNVFVGNRPRRITKILFIGNRPQPIKTIFYAIPGE